MDDLDSLIQCRKVIQQKERKKVLLMRKIAEFQALLDGLETDLVRLRTKEIEARKRVQKL